MKKSNILMVLILVISLAIMNTNVNFAFEKRERQSTLPRTNNGVKWRIGYCESEPFVNFAGTLFAILNGLEEKGWITNIDNLPYEEGQSDSKIMWEWLSNNDTGPYIEFVSDAHYSLYLSSEDIEERIISRLKNKEDIDLMLVMGSDAGKLLASKEHSIPTMVFSATNAVQSKIIKSERDSGLDHVWAHMDSDRFQRQISVLYDIFSFKKLGIVYENSLTARSYSAIDDIKKIANSKGFELIEYYVENPRNKEDEDRYYKELSLAYEKLSKEVDAMYITVAFIESNKLPQLLKPFYEKKIPVFSQLGSEEVKYGALMSISLTDFKNLGRFGAEQIIKVLEGNKPRELNQVFKSTPRIVINMEVAEKIEYKVPFETLLVSDKIYRKIQR